MEARRGQQLLRGRRLRDLLTAMMQTTIARAYLPWYRRRVPIWGLALGALVVVAAIALGWTYGRALLVLVVLTVVVNLIDPVLARLVRARHPLPATVPISEFRMPLPISEDLLRGNRDPT